MLTLNFLSFILSWFLLPEKAPAPALSVSEEISWKANRRLTWNDFKARPDEKDDLHAMTSSNIDMKVKCENNELKVKVKSLFSTAESWSKNKKSDRLLFHEQLHFDITEIYSRRLRKEILLLKDPCNHPERLNELADRLFSAWKKREDQYDSETNHGLDEAQMKTWTKIIETELNELADFQDE